MSEKFFRNSSKAIIMRIYCRNGENLNSFVVVFSRDKIGLNGFAKLVLNLQIWCNVLPIFRICLAFFSIVSLTDCISTFIPSKPSYYQICNKRIPLIGKLLLIFTLLLWGFPHQAELNTNEKYCPTQIPTFPNLIRVFHILLNQFS